MASENAIAVNFLEVVVRRPRRAQWICSREKAISTYFKIAGAPLGFAEDGCKMKVKSPLNMYYSELYNIFVHQFHNFWVPKV